MKRKMIICAVLLLAMISSMAGCAEREAVSMPYSADDTYGVTDGMTNGEAVPEKSAGEDFSVTEEAAYDDAAAALGSPKGMGDWEGEAGAGADEYMATYGSKSVSKTTATTAAAATATADKADKEKVPEIKRPEAGQLTAGEWCDNDNWGFFTNLISSDLISFPSFGLQPLRRTAVTVKDKDGSPVVNASVKLYGEKSNLIWTAVTNKDGVAFLFGDENDEGTTVEIESQGVKKNAEIKKKSDSDQTGKVMPSKTADNELEVVFDGKGKLYDSTDIMFILDTTSSMSDEMLFLQSEFTAITKAIDADKTRYAVNFYRDEGDEYITKCNDFTENVKELQKKLNDERALGGGDYPEAVAEILDESIFKGSWKEESVKIAFLIYDAPPHEGKEESLRAAVKAAAEKGIRVVPVVASDSNRDTELFGRALAISTGGRYVFLTDDSGIGNSHSEPIIGSYEVRPLYDIIVEIINDYKQ